MFENNLIAGSAGQATGFYPYAIDQSLRFNDDDSAYLERTPATAGNRKTWTWSGWVKRGNLGTIQLFFGSYLSNSDSLSIYFASDSLVVGSYAATNLQTNAVYRDVSAWYHVHLAVDTTQATAADRMQLYVNGEEVTSFSVATYPSLNADLSVNATYNHTLGSGGGSPAYYFDGYMAEVNFIDGQALDPTSFGEFKSGVWVANRYTGTYGTNGFYLPFENGLGNDESGNGNDWTPNNLAATDIVLDSPTNNFATWNPLKPTTHNFKDGNLVLDAVANYYQASSTLPIPEDTSVYFELTWTGFSGTSGYGYFGVCTESTAVSTANDNNPVGTYGCSNFGAKTDDGVQTVGFFSWSSTPDGTVYGFAVDRTNDVLKIYRNGVYESGKDITIPSTGNLFIWASVYDPVELTLNAGQLGFTYTPPAGFLALCTANLPEPAISPADDASPSDYFNTVLYSGNLSNPRSITGLGFQPDWVWVKQRSSNGGGATFHQIYDSVRGVQKLLRSNTTDAELANPSNGGVESFDSDGFTIEGSSASLNMNDTGETYVAWNWKAGGAGVTNTDGSITSTVSASPESGFSIVSYTGNGTTGATVGHGLDSQIEMLIVKDRDAGVYQWNSWHVGLSVDHYIPLNTTSGEDSSVLIWDTSGMTNSVFTHGSFTGGHNVNGNNYIAYCFHSVEGYSKFGSYTGNGSTDGPFVYTGFRPAFVIVKRTDSSGFSWMMHDTARMPYNQIDSLLVANSNAAENTNNSIDMDIVSNGFKFRGDNTNTNASGGTYIYMAFAENPFKFSNAR